MKAKIITSIIVFLLTISSFIIFLNIVSGNIGNKETWKIVCSLSGFIILLTFSSLLMYRLVKK